MAKYPISPSSKPIKINEFVQLLPAKTVGELQDVFALPPGEEFRFEPLIQKLSETRFLLCYTIMGKHVRTRVMEVVNDIVTIGTELVITNSESRLCTIGIDKDNRVVVVTTYNSRYRSSLDVCKLNVEGLNITLAEQYKIKEIQTFEYYSAKIMDASTVLFAIHRDSQGPFDVGVHNVDTKKTISAISITGSRSGYNSGDISIGVIQDKFYASTDESFCTFSLDSNLNVHNVDVATRAFGTKVVVVGNIIFGASVEPVPYDSKGLKCNRAIYDKGIYTIGQTKTLATTQYIAVLGLHLLNGVTPILFSFDTNSKNNSILSYFDIRSDNVADYDASRIINNAASYPIIVLGDKAIQCRKDENISKFKMIYPFYPLVASNTGFTDGVAKQSGKANDIIKIITKK